MEGERERESEREKSWPRFSSELLGVKCEAKSTAVNQYSNMQANGIWTLAVNT